MTTDRPQVGDLVEVRSGSSAYAVGTVTEVFDYGFYFQSVGDETKIAESRSDIHIRILHRAGPDQSQVAAFRDLLNALGIPSRGKDRSILAEYLVRNGARLPREKIPPRHTTTYVDDEPLLIDIPLAEVDDRIDRMINDPQGYFADARRRAARETQSEIDT